MKSKRFFHIGMLAVALLTGCSSAPAPTAEHAGHQQQAPNGDIWETTASISQLPSFLENVDPDAKEEIKEIYRLAAQNQDLLKWIPCYCGCAESADHQNNGNCFIKEINADGSVVWDDHGTRCGTCLEIAYTASMMKQQGKSVKEIRDFIDNKYKEDYAAPTPTPMPQ